MKPPYLLLRLFVLAGCIFTLVKSPRLPVVHATNCTNYPGGSFQEDCPSGCTSSTFTNYPYGGSGIYPIYQNPSPCLPGTCLQPGDAVQQPVQDCTNCCLHLAQTCYSGGISECCCGAPNVICDAGGTNKCCVPDYGFCESTFECCHSACVNMMCGGSCFRILQCDIGESFDFLTCTCLPSTPIIVDIDGSGYRLTDYAGGVSFDMFSTLKPFQVSWTARGSTNAFLALDRNGNGKIDDGSELFGNFAPQPPSDDQNGFIALAQYDTAEKGGNGDGVIDGRDTVYSRLRLWIDVNHNAISEPSELHTLQEFGIDWLSFDYKLASRMDRYGNTFRYRAKVGSYQSKGNGPSRYAWDVVLLTAPPSGSPHSPARLRL